VRFTLAAQHVRHRIAPGLLALATSLAWALAQAEGVEAAAPVQEAANPFGGPALRVSDEALGEMRGGFVADGGLQVSFGIDRAVYVDGNLVAQTHLEVNQLGELTGSSNAQTVPPVSAGVTVVQGNGSTVLQTIPLPAGVATIVQNSADGRQLQSITAVNAVANSLGLWHRLDVQAAVNEGLVAALQH
jgi:hypothetical protein